MNHRDRQAAVPNLEINSIDPGAGIPAALHEAGLRHMRAGRYLDAQICCQQALAADSRHADSLHLMGLLSHQAQQYELAVAWLARAIRQQPKAEYLSSLGTALQQQGRLEEALKAIDKAVQLNPEDARLWIELGTVLAELQRPTEALLAFEHVLKLDPNHWDAAYRCGFILHGLGRQQEAVSCFDLSDRLRPNQGVV